MGYWKWEIVFCLTTFVDFLLIYFPYRRSVSSVEIVVQKFVELIVTVRFDRWYIQGPAEIPDDLVTHLWVESLEWGICRWAPF
jgi:hypothetical protein